MKKILPIIMILETIHVDEDVAVALVVAVLAETITIILVVEEVILIIMVMAGK